MLNWVGSALGIAKGIMDWLTGRQRAQQREEDRQAGRNEQKLSSKDASLERAREANAREEDISGLDDDALDERMRKSME